MQYTIGIHGLTGALAKNTVAGEVFSDIASALLAQLKEQLGSTRYDANKLTSEMQAASGKVAMGKRFFFTHKQGDAVYLCYALPHGDNFDVRLPGAPKQESQITGIAP